ncbi:amidohydrolase family protein [Saccharopolyspora sp. NPDC049357]|uniref:amidohydrolase family protein n=1 Tax=Saccharopolyspora sp. NPDC049357 TaxID=3154507 RepID=UPI00341B3AC9
MQRLITADTILTGRAGQTVPKGAVLVDDDRIVATGHRDDVSRQASNEAVLHEYAGHTVLPGLINCHVHLALDASSEPLQHYLDSDDTDLLLAMAGRAQAAARSGVTTLRDLGDRNGLVFHLRNAIEHGALAGPRILAAGAPLTPPNGHCHFFGGEVDGEDDIRARIRDSADRGADLIKIMASGGQITPTSPPMWASQFTGEQLHLAVSEARSAGLPVAAHAHGTEAIAEAVDAGVSTVEHCTWMTGGGGYDTRDDVAKTMAERGIHACLAWPPHWRAFLDRLGPDRAKQIVSRVRWMRDLGVPMIPGTDAGLRGSSFTGYAEALGLYEYLGFSRDEIIEMATTTAAEALGLNDVGSIASGYSADLIAVEGDPRTDLAPLSKPRLVIARGELIADV